MLLDKLNNLPPQDFENALKEMITLNERDRTNEIESEILGALRTAWNRFVGLAQTHGDDIPDFRRAIHECQRIIATRQMRRINPELWITDPYSDCELENGDENRRLGG
jgi:hypothetical protein